MKIQIDQYNYVELDLQNGGRIIKLVLNGHIIVEAQQPFSDLGSGMFLMFPWISKVSQNPYDIQLKNQYHGFTMNTSRSITIQPLSQQSIKFKLTQKLQREDRHNFLQNYTLSKGQLSLQFRVLINQKDPHPFCFGFHPYLQLDHHCIDQLQVKTDITTLLQFDQNTLPIYPFQQKQIHIEAKGSYNNLFKGGSYFQLISKERTHIKLQSNLPFWQIYNPPQRKTIAIQPASFCGNLYDISLKDPKLNLPSTGTVKFTVWSQ